MEQACEEFCVFIVFLLCFCLFRFLPLSLADMMDEVILYSCDSKQTDVCRVLWSGSHYGEHLLSSLNGSA